MIICFFFFFKQKTAYEMRISDWSSDVCSSDLAVVGQQQQARGVLVEPADGGDRRLPPTPALRQQRIDQRSLFLVRACYADRLVQQIGRASCRERGCQYV